jgi:hypothetical protein
VRCFMVLLHGGLSVLPNNPAAPSASCLSGFNPSLSVLLTRYTVTLGEVQFPKWWIPDLILNQGSLLH